MIDPIFLPPKMKLAQEKRKPQRVLRNAALCSLCFSSCLLCQKLSLSSTHSLRNDFTGLAKAAFTLCKPIKMAVTKAKPSKGSRNQAPDRPGFDIYWIDAAVIDELKKSRAAQTLIEPALGETIIGALYQNDVETAAPALKKWLALYPQNLDATVIYSSTLRKQKQYASAAQVLNNVADQWKNNTNILMERALVQFGLNKEEEANKILSPLLVEGDQLRERYLYLAVALLDMAKIQPSEAYFEMAMSIHASSYPYFNRACTLARMGEKDRAFAALNQAVTYGSLVLKTDYQNVADLKPLESDVKWKLLMARLK